MVPDDLIGERHVVVAMEAFTDPVDVQLRAVLRVVVKELKEPLRLLVVIFGRRAACFLDRVPVRTPHAHQRNRLALFFLSEISLFPPR